LSTKSSTLPAAELIAFERSIQFPRLAGTKSNTSSADGGILPGKNFTCSRTWHLALGFDEYAIWETIADGMTSSPAVIGRDSNR
jgi:hypothetical protein